MNFALSREIYGLEPWCMDIKSLPTMMGLLNSFRSGAKLEIPETKYNTPTFCTQNLTPTGSAKLITRPWQLEYSDENFQGIGVINIDGPITVSGGDSSFGMEQISEMMLEMAEDTRILGFVVRGNSGGGSTSAIQIMTDTIKLVRETKTVYGSIKKGGTACSAMYAILAPCEKIFSESEMNIVGGIGTLVQGEGRKANTTDKDGVKHLRVYATKSVKKNIEWEEAFNNDNYELIINDLLNPINENLLTGIITARPLLSGISYDDGHVVFSKDAVGNFIDGIETFSDVVQMVLDSASALVETPENFFESNNNNNPNSLTMKKEEYKAAHPTEHDAIIAQGVEAERERVNSWLVYADADAEAVNAGIQSGKSITPSQSHAFMVKMNASAMAAALKGDSAKPVTTAATAANGGAADATDENKEYAAVDAKLLNK